MIVRYPHADPFLTGWCEISQPRSLAVQCATAFEIFAGAIGHRHYRVVACRMRTSVVRQRPRFEIMNSPRALPSPNEGPNHRLTLLFQTFSPSRTEMKRSIEVYSVESFQVVSTCVIKIENECPRSKLENAQRECLAMQKAIILNSVNSLHPLRQNLLAWKCC